MPREQYLELVEKIRRVPLETRIQFIEEVQKDHVNPSEKWRHMAYLKGSKDVPKGGDRPRQGVEQGILDYFERRRINFPNMGSLRTSLYNTIRGEPLRRVYWGLHTGEEDSEGAPLPIELPSEIVQPMVDLIPGNGVSIAAYMLAGRWKSKYDPKVLRIMPEFQESPLIYARKLIMAGMAGIVKVHNSFVPGTEEFKAREKRNSSSKKQRIKYNEKLTKLQVPFGRDIFNFFYPDELSQKEMEDSIEVPEYYANVPYH